MPDNPEELIARLLIGDLSPSERCRISEMLHSDPELLATYQRQVVMHALLAWHHGSASQVSASEIDPLVIAEFLHDAEMAARRQLEEEAKERARIAAEEAARLREIERLQQRRVRRPEPIVIPYSVAYLGAAGLAASLIWMASTFIPLGDSPAMSNDRSIAQDAQPEALPVIATVTKSVEAKFAIAKDDSVAETQWHALGAAAGTPLTTGRYDLGYGVIEIEFDSGVTAVLEAPANFEIVSAGRVYLTRGRIVGKVPPQAIGFTIETESATIVDLGTEFGISVPEVKDGQAADVIVFDGEVEVVAAANAGQPTETRADVRKRLRMDDSVRVNDAGSFSDSETSSQLYFRKVPTSRELTQKMAYERWLVYSKKMAADPDVVAYYTFNDQRPEDSQLLNRAGDGQSLHGEIRGAQWSEGRWRYKQALRFAGSDPYDNPSNYVQVDIPGEYRAVTLSAWVNIDAFPGHRDKLSGLLMTDEWNRPGQLHWQIQGDGRLQAGAYFGSGNAKSYQVSAEEPIHSEEFGNWHHVGLVCSPEGQQMLFYFDGRRIGIRDIPAQDFIVFGPARIGGWKPSTDASQGYAPDDFRALHGRMDELIVLRRAMSDDEVYQLYEAGRP